MCDCDGSCTLVPVAEVEARAGWRVDLAGVEVFEFWTGEPAVRADEARKLLGRTVEDRTARHEQWRRERRAQLAAEREARLRPALIETHDSVARGSHAIRGGRGG